MSSGAAGFFFQGITADNRCVRYPAKGSWKLSPFEYPIGVPNGVYQVFFVRGLEDTAPLPPANPLKPYPEISFFFPRHRDEPEERPAQALPAATPAPLRTVQTELHAAFEQLPEVRSARVEFLQRQLMLELQENTHDVSKYGHSVQEIAGLFELNRGYRRELQEAYETVMALSKRTVEDSQHMMTLFRGMQEMQAEAVVAMKQQLASLASPPPPPPPVNYTGLGEAAIHLLRDVSVAMIQLKAADQRKEQPATPALRGEVVSASIQAPQIAASQAAPEVQESPAPVPPAPPAPSPSPSSALAATDAEKRPPTETPAAAPSVDAPRVPSVQSPLLDVTTPVVTPPAVTGAIDLAPAPEQLARGKRMIDRLRSLSELDAALLLSTPARMVDFLRSIEEEKQ